MADLISCGVMPASFFETLASCIVENTDGDKFLNVICYDNDCANLTQGDCDELRSDPEGYVVANAFGVDACGLPALKLRVCVVADSENRT